MSTVFPTSIEVIKFISLILDLQPATKKKLDDLEREIFVDPIRVDALFNESVSERLAKVLGEDIGQKLSYQLEILFKQYIKLVANTDVSGLERHHILGPLIECILVNWSNPLVMDLVRSMSACVAYEHTGDDLTDSSSAFGQQFFKTTLALLMAKKEPNLVSYVVKVLDKLPDAFDGKCAKEDNDRVSSWRRGEHIPDTASIVNITQNPIYRSWLLTASALERIKQYSEGVGFIQSVGRSLVEQRRGISFELVVSNMRSHLAPRIQFLAPVIDEVQHGLMRTAHKPVGSREKLDRVLFALEDDYEKGILPNNKYFVHHHRARFHVYSGDLEAAHQYYKKAVISGAYMAGDELRGILAEAKEVAASQDKPDKVSIKNYKWLELQFGFETHSVERTTSSNKFEDTVEDWEVNILRQNLGKTFPPEGMFPGCTLPKLDYRSGYLSIVGLPKLDLKNPNKKIWLDVAKIKRTPQLVAYAQLGKFEEIKALLESGADVNATSDVSETALIFALEKMNLQGDDAIFGWVRENQQPEFFELISSYQHHVDTVNRRTQKKKITALSLAVKSGRLKVVKKVLSMGADPMLRADSDNQTPLNLAIKIIANLKNLHETIQSNAVLDHSKAALDSFRRETAGAYGSTLEQNRVAKESLRANTGINAFLKAAHQNYVKHSSLDEMRAIARELIYAGSDPNAEHKTPFPGYTPLMLVAEIDETELFNLMIQSGGDPYKTVWLPHTDISMNSYQIRGVCRAKRALGGFIV